jgi:hypothetical protein
MVIFSATKFSNHAFDGNLHLPVYKDPNVRKQNEPPPKGSPGLFVVFSFLIIN